MSHLDPALFEQSAKLGRTLNLRHCVYGPAHFGAGFVHETPPYYGFLAGWVRTLGLTHIAELGTHFGGSIEAMIAGIPEERLLEARVVTVDVTRLNRSRLERHRCLTLVQGDSLAPSVVASVVGAFDRHIDLLYVDTVHSFEQTLENTCLYANRLKPRFIVFDDIHLNPAMERFWRFVVSSGSGETHDVTAVSERGSAGFGLLACRYPFHWPESSPRVRALKRAAFAARLRVAGALSTDAKERLRSWVGQPTRR